MFSELIAWPITSERIQWHGRHVLKELGGDNHFFLRVTLTGTYFAERSAEAFVQIGRLRSRFVEITPDGLSVNAYFDRPPDEEGIIEFGYAYTVFLRCGRRFDLRDAIRLQRALLPQGVRNLERFAGLLD